MAISTQRWLFGHMKMVYAIYIGFICFHTKKSIHIVYIGLFVFLRRKHVDGYLGLISINLFTRRKEQLGYTLSALLYHTERKCDYATIVLILL